MEMLKVRNLLAYDYDGIIVKQSCQTIVNIYLDKFSQFQERVEQLQL